MAYELNTFRALGKDHGAHQTWHPITYAMYGLLNGFLPYREMPNINRDHAVWLSLRKMALINFQKLPAKTRTNERELRMQVPPEERQLLVRQIETYRPHIVIGGRTLHLLKKDLGITSDHDLAHGHFQKDGVLFLHTLNFIRSPRTPRFAVKQFIICGTNFCGTPKR